MSMRLYLAMTAAEYHSAGTLPESVAWMACHFSSYGVGLCNLPNTLPKDAMLIVNDRTPPHLHDPQQIVQQLTALAKTLRPACILLDFQHPDNPETASITQAILRALPCPVGVTEHYAAAFQCPIFLPPPPMCMDIEQYLAPWKGREIWLEAATGTSVITLTQQGAHMEADGQVLPEEPHFTDSQIHCSYHIRLKDNAAVFTLHRSRKQLEDLLAEAQRFGVTQAVGFYQQLG